MNVFIAAGAAVLGAAVGAGGGAWVATRQIESAETTAREERREDLYANVLVTTSNYRETLAESWQGNAAGEAVNAAEDEYNAALFAVLLIATDDIGNAVRELDVSVDQLANSVHRHNGGVLDLAPDRMSALELGVGHAAEDFMNSARGDLG